MDVSDIGKGGHGLNGEKKIGRIANETIAVEALGCDASDGDGLGVDPEVAADDGRIGGVRVPPRLIADDSDDGSTFGVVFAREEAACPRAKTESSKIVAGNEFAHDGAGIFLGAIATHGDGAVHEAGLDGGEIVEFGEVLLEV